MFLNFVRWLMGYTSFEICGVNPEKFINLIRKNNINTWDLKIKNNILTGKIHTFEYKGLENLAKKLNYTISIKLQKGLPLRTLKYKNRFGILAGIFLFILTIFIFSSYIWNIKIYGNETIPQKEILEVLENLGVSSGCLKKNLDFPLIEQLAMVKLDKISWISINPTGSCVNILIKEKTQKPEFMVNNNEPCNIVSKKDGQIVRFETYQGTPIIKADEIVTKGQLLISGICETPNFENFFVSANAKVLAKTTNKITKEIPVNCTTTENTGKIIKKMRIKFLGLELPSFNFFNKINSNFEPEFSHHTLKILKKDIPIKIQKEIWHEKKYINKKLSSEEAVNQARNLVINDEKNNFKNAEILNESVDILEKNEKYIITFTISCIENIAKKERIFFE